MPPRLASPRSTTAVETDHPLLSFQLPDARVSADRRTHQFTPAATVRQGKTGASEKLRGLQLLNQESVLLNEERTKPQSQNHGK